jgi:hypothetical protein
MPRNCVNSADNVCYIYGEVKFARQRKAITITMIVKKAYHLYFGCKIGNQDKSWGLHTLPQTCNKSFTVAEWQKTCNAIYSLEGAK